MICDKKFNLVRLTTREEASDTVSPVPDCAQRFKRLALFDPSKLFCFLINIIISKSGGKLFEIVRISDSIYFTSHPKKCEIARADCA